MKRLYRSRRYRQIAGICGGLGEYFNVDPTLVRLIFVCLAIFTAFFPMLLIYIIAWLIIPSEEEVK